MENRKETKFQDEWDVDVDGDRRSAICMKANSSMVRLDIETNMNQIQNQSIET